MTTGPEPPRRVAYCAPGREAVTALILALRGEQVDEVTASRILAGADYAVVVTDTPMQLPEWPVTFTRTTDLDLLERLRFTRWPMPPVRLSSIPGPCI
jgi:hypothetical protein